MSFLAPIAASALGGLASTGISSLASSLFGGKKNQTPVSVGINAGGLSGANGTLTASADRMGLVGGVRDAFGNQADELGGLRAALTPGFGALSHARLAEVENARQASIGTLRDNMARRRVLGSSFGNDALARADAEFGQQKSQVAAESFLQELDANTNLLNQESAARAKSFQTGLDELNLEADLASKLSATASSQIGAASRLEAELAAKNAAGAGKFFGQSFADVGSEVKKGVQNIFSNWSSPAANSLGGSLSFAG